MPSRRNGPCSLIETKHEKDLLHRASQHHVHDVILSEVSKHSFGPLSGPDIALFKRFHEQTGHIWIHITSRQHFKIPHVQKFQHTVNTDLMQLNLPRTLYNLATSLEMTTANYLNSLSSFLVIISPRLMAPDAMQQARRMAKILYSIK